MDEKKNLYSMTRSNWAAAYSIILQYNPADPGVTYIMSSSSANVIRSFYIYIYQNMRLLSFHLLYRNLKRRDFKI